MAVLKQIDSNTIELSSVITYRRNELTAEKVRLEALKEELLTRKDLAKYNVSQLTREIDRDIKRVNVKLDYFEE